MTWSWRSMIMTWSWNHDVIPSSMTSFQMSRSLNPSWMMSFHLEWSHYSRLDRIWPNILHCICKQDGFIHSVHLQQCVLDSNRGSSGMTSLQPRWSHLSWYLTLYVCVCVCTCVCHGVWTSATSSYSYHFTHSILLAAMVSVCDKKWFCPFQPHQVQMRRTHILRSHSDQCCERK